jgi:peroxiredoxin (alkyl hydroperoxide reductase subunit C)
MKQKLSFSFPWFCVLPLGLCCMALKKPSGETLLVGRPAPQFSAQAVVDGSVVSDFSLQDLHGKYTVLLFYPLDFTFVCPTELHAFQKKLGEFTERNAQVVAISVDSAYSHLAWLNTPVSSGGIQGVTYPLVSDLDKSISRRFHVLNEDQGIAYRGLVLIDREGVVRHQLVNDLPLGRNVDEVLRMLDALTTWEEFGEVCPANWNKGDKTIKPTPEGLHDYFEELEYK